MPGISLHVRLTFDWLPASSAGRPASQPACKGRCRLLLANCKFASAVVVVVVVPRRWRRLSRRRRRCRCQQSNETISDCLALCSSALSVYLCICMLAACLLGSIWLGARNAEAATNGSIGAATCCRRRRSCHSRALVQVIYRLIGGARRWRRRLRELSQRLAHSSQRAPPVRCKQRAATRPTVSRRASGRRPVKQRPAQASHHYNNNNNNNTSTSQSLSANCKPPPNNMDSLGRLAGWLG